MPFWRLTCAAADGSAACWLLGIILFSGSLYVLTLISDYTDTRHDHTVGWTSAGLRVG